MLRDLLPAEQSRDDAALSLGTRLTPATCAHYSHTQADPRTDFYFCSRSIQAEALLLIFFFCIFDSGFF